ncbi:hypothetical protein DFJ73DRAFT_36146 [Zopfochytrium polystomum]|nr:hypothetical protein DFJ73DRAFT_36146 [Zopfochytrium polystomum]
MGAQCGDVAKCVGQMDSYCQSTNWDSICVSEAGQCGASCSGGGYSTDYPTPTYSYPSYSYPSYSYPTYYSSSALPSYTPVVCHDVCSIGDPLDQNCGSIASCVIASDSYCKVAKWDSICVAEAQVCGASCYTTPTPTPTPTPGYTPSPTYSSATYTDDNGCHDVCLLGGPMTADCSDVASCVVGQASSCGTDQWDATCVSLADQCGGGCSSSTSATTATTATSSCHDVCSVGLGMDETCGDVATCVVGLNSTCYTTWDSTCVGTAVSSCNANCTTPSTPLPDMICHDPCLVGGALPARCGTEVACVLQTNPECETDSWSSNCVSVLQSSCSVDCTASTWTQPCVPKTAVIFSSVSTTTATSTSVTTAITTVPTTTTTTSLKVSTLTKTATTSTTKTTTSQTTTTQLTTVTTKATKTTTTTSVSTVLSTAPKWTTTIPTTTTVVSVSVSPTTTTKVVTATTTAKTAIVKSTILVVSTTVVKTTVTPPAIKTVTVSK